MPIASLCVYCGSNSGKNPVFAQNAAAFGEFLAARRIRLVYGGASCGTMGILADHCRLAGGAVLGVITGQLDAIVGHSELDDYRVVPDMATRKKLFLELSDAAVALPGGYGTADEFFEALSLQTLGINRKPVALLNVAGYFDPVLDWMKRMVEENFLAREQFEQLIVETDFECLLERLEAYRFRQIKKWEI